MDSIYRMMVRPVFILACFITRHYSFFFLNDPAPTEFSPLPHPAPLPIKHPAQADGADRRAAGQDGRRCRDARRPTAGDGAREWRGGADHLPAAGGLGPGQVGGAVRRSVDRKSTRLNSSHLVISYAVFCLK